MTTIQNANPGAIAVSISPTDTLHNTVSPQTVSLVLAYNNIALAQTGVTTVTQSAAVLGQQLHTLEDKLSALGSGAPAPDHLVSQGKDLDEQLRAIQAMNEHLQPTNPQTPPRSGHTSNAFNTGQIGNTV